VELINLTPHQVDYIAADGTVMSFPCAGLPPRVALRRGAPAHIDVGGFEVTVHTSTVDGPPELPEPRRGVLLIVSRLVAEHAPNRDDLVFPDDLVRDHHGAIIGCRTFGRLG
jgi:hypothetical protein